MVKLLVPPQGSPVQVTPNQRHDLATLVAIMLLIVMTCVPTNILGEVTSLNKKIHFFCEGPEYSIMGLGDCMMHYINIIITDLL